MSSVPQDQTAESSGSHSSHALADTAAFGEFLRRARQERGLTLLQVCKETKIPRAHLEALEEGNFALVPTGTYRRGEVLAYAAVVGLDRSVVLARLQTAIEGAAARQSTNLSGAARAVDRGEIRRRFGPRTVTGIGMGAAMTILATSLWTGARLEPRPLADAVPAGSERQPVIRQVGAASVKEVSRGNSARATEPAQPSNTRTTTAAPATQGKRDPVAARAGRDGRLVVITQPAGARVTINGVGWGVTPLTVDNLPPGTTRIRVTSQGFSAAERTVELPTVGATTVRIALRERAGTDPPPPHE